MRQRGRLALLVAACWLPVAAGAARTAAAGGVPGWEEALALLQDLGRGRGQQLAAQEHALAASLALWPGVGAARVHLSCAAPAAWSLQAAQEECRGAVVLQPRAGAAADELPRPEDVQRLLAAAIPISDPGAIPIIWAAPPTGEESAGSRASSPGGGAAARPATEQVGPFSVAAGSGGALRLTLALLAAAVVGLAALALLARRQHRAPAEGTPRMSAGHRSRSRRWSPVQAGPIHGPACSAELTPSRGIPYFVGALPAVARDLGREVRGEGAC